MNAGRLKLSTGANRLPELSATRGGKVRQPKPTALHTWVAHAVQGLYLIGPPTRPTTFCHQANIIIITFIGVNIATNECRKDDV